MNRLPLFALAFALLFMGCVDAPDTYEAEPEAETAVAEFMSYGDELAMDVDLVVITPAELTADPSAYDGTVVRVEGTIAKVCRNKGCWLTLENPTATPIRVDVPRDAEGQYVYTFPTDLPVSDVIIEGTAKMDTTSVETLRHFAEDEGRSQEEIDAITEPQPTVILTANGALVKPAAAVQS